jgi:predicted aconitase with swiveling domain
MLHEMVSRRVAPLGIILHSTNPVIVQGAVLAEIPIMQGLLPPAHQTIQTGDWIRMKPEDGVIEVWR